MVADGAKSSSPISFFSLKLVKLSNSFLIVLMSLLMSTFFFVSRPVVDETLGSESVSWEGVVEVTLLFVTVSDNNESGLGEEVVELASPFSTFLNCCVEGTIVDVDTVFVEAVVRTVDLAEEAVIPVDFKVGVTVAEGFVNAAGLLSLSTRGLMGIVTADADVPALLGRGKGLEEASSVGFEDCT